MKRFNPLPIIKIFSPALQAQLSLTLGFTLCLIVSYFYLFINDARFPQERPSSIWVGIILSFGSFLLGNFLARKFSRETPLNLKQGAIIVFLTWVIAVAISATVFVVAGFPDPNNAQNFSLYRKYVDGIFESISGYTTAGGSILPSVEVFPRSILLWRSTTHLIGGMGIAYLAVTLWRRFKFKRETIINSEAEGPNYIQYEAEQDAIRGGMDFIKIYLLLAGIMFLLMITSGSLFRSSPYLKWYDNTFDSINYTFSVMGTGGFGTYDTSAGLPLVENGQTIIGGLRNPVSEWIMAIFMFIAGSNLGLWFILLYKNNIRDFYKNTELRAYTGFVAFITIGIWLVLLQNKIYETPLDALRYAFFNVTTIISTTGLANTDFTKWPAAAAGLLFTCYLVGGMVGSTAGGPKVLRFVILYRYIVQKLQNLLYGRHKSRFTVDGVRYNDSSAGLVVTTILLYLFIFLGGAVLIMVVSPQTVSPDGVVKSVDFASAISASIANLGNIGPAVAVGTINAGPAGNYSAYNELAKLIMAALMLIGRVGVLTILMLFITGKGLSSFQDSVEEQKFDSDEPIFHS